MKNMRDAYVLATHFFGHAFPFWPRNPVLATQSRFSHAIPFWPRNPVLATQSRFGHASIFSHDSSCCCFNKLFLFLFSISGDNFSLQVSSVNNERIESMRRWGRNGTSCRISTNCLWFSRDSAVCISGWISAPSSSAMASSWSALSVGVGVARTLKVLS